MDWRKISIIIVFKGTFMSSKMVQTRSKGSKAKRVTSVDLSSFLLQSFVANHFSILFSFLCV